MIAGPSSSGKTSFANRLSIQLRSNGLNPHPISLDNYFVNREDTPLNEDGSYNFECLEALDVEQFNEDMTRLLKGERVEMPEFNFITGKRENERRFLQLGKDDVLVIEGIHGLNEKMSYALPAESKFKIYISALTTLSIDDHNRIATTDGRLLRRIVRDARTRGASAKKTISMWPSVRAGEEANIFPFQEEADEMFNSAQIYELAVIKQYAEPLLFSIDKDEPEYYEAKRLLKFLDYFVSVDSSMLPRNSICREFVGGSCFQGMIKGRAFVTGGRFFSDMGTVLLSGFIQINLTKEPSPCQETEPSTLSRKPSPWLPSGSVSVTKAFHYFIVLFHQC